jgi:hypothetical protein
MVSNLKIEEAALRYMPVEARLGDLFRRSRDRQAQDGGVDESAEGSGMKEPDYCGCCGREADAGEWCSDCKEHIDPRKTFWDATYFAQHGTDCPFQNQAKNFAYEG